MEDSPAKNPDMQHSGKRRSFWSVCAAFVRWVFVVLLLLRLAWGFYCQTSWKEITIYVLLLGLLTVVSKSWRKYGWGLVGLAIIGVAIWIFLPARDTGNWHTFIYDAEIKAINEKYGVAEDENAAVYYTQLKPKEFLEEYETKLAAWDPEDATLNRPWTADEFPEVAAWFEEQKETIAPFWKAVKYDRCWFSIRFGSDHLPERLEHFRPIRHATDTLQRMTYLDIGNNDIPAAIEKCLALLQCAKHMQQQIPLLDQLLSKAIFGRTTEIVREIVIDYPIHESSLNSLHSEIGQYEIDWEQFLKRYLEFDKAVYKYMAGLAFEINGQGDTRLNLNMAEIFSKDDLLFPALNHEETKQPSIFWKNRKQKFLRLCELVSKPVTPQDLFNYADTAYQQSHERIKSGDFNHCLPENWLEKLKYNRDPLRISMLALEIQIPALEKRQRKLAQLKTLQNGMLIVIALKRYFNEHGQWPQRLAAIEADLPEGVLSNLELGWEFMYYRPEDSDSFVLYSYGGDDTQYHKTRNRPWIASEVGPNDILIWPEELDESGKTE